MLLLFSHPACGPCAALLPEVGRWQREHDEELAVALVSSGDLEDDRARAAEHGLTRVLRDDEDGVADRYGATGTPMALLVGPDGRVASELVVGATAIGALVSTVVDHSTRRCCSVSSEANIVKDLIDRGLRPIQADMARFAAGLRAMNTASERPPASALNALRAARDHALPHRRRSSPFPTSI